MMADPGVDEVARQMIQQHMDQCDERMEEIRGNAKDIKDSVIRIHQRLSNTSVGVISLLVTILVAIGAAYLGLSGGDTFVLQ